MTTKRRVLLDGNGSTKINVEGLGVYVPASELAQIKQNVGNVIEGLKVERNLYKFERDKLEAKLAKLDELATRFIEDSEEIAEFFEASGGRNHLVLAKDVRELADEMADFLNDQAVDNRHIDDIDDIGNLNATAGNKLEALRDSIQACENQGYRVMFGNWQVTGAILSDSDGVIELVQE